MKLLASLLAIAFALVPAVSLPQALPTGAAVDPPAPIAPAVMNRDEAGRATVRAVRTTTPFRIDGRLSESPYRDVPAMTGFIQTEPTAGAPATERTEAWVFYDDTTIYIAFRCWESRVGHRVANEMRRDNTTIIDNDHVAFILDPFLDHTNALYFAITSLGGAMDGQFTSFQYNGDWNPVWDWRAENFEDGWAVEAAIPFSSLRYPPGRTQTWGINLQRTVRLKNELSFLTRLGNARGPSAINQMDREATLVGLEVPPASRNIDVKPYAISSLTTDRAVVPAISNDAGADAGIDVKYSITQNLTADLTVNTDFAQVEADEQQVNLTRFSLFFPEKRDFFLENQGMFSFGLGGAAAALGFSTAGDMPVVFYSRRIGLELGREVPIRAGGRVTGRVGLFNVGALNIQTGAADGRTEGTNFTVLRVKRDLLRRSTIGAIYTGRSQRETAAGRNTVVGVDGLFNFHSFLSVNTYWAHSESAGPGGDGTSYRAQLDYSGDRYGVQAEHLAVDPGFSPDVGFLRRRDLRKTFGSFKFSPRPANVPSVRKFYGLASMNYLENTAGRMELREAIGEGGVEFQNGDKFSVAFASTDEYIPRPFPIAAGTVVPVGSYRYDNAKASYMLARQHRVGGTVSVEHGSLYDGDKTGVAFSRGRLTLSPRLSAEPSIAINHVRLPQGTFTNTLVGSRLTNTLTPRLFVSALVQYNSGTSSVGTNVRLRWEYEPGSEFFIVYNDQRDTRPAGFPETTNRAIVVKLNKLFRF